MGNLLRCYWLPALLESEVAERDGAPVRLRLLGEDLVCFRDTQGRIGIVDAYCAHRRAGLYFARNEECGLRCVYHGWKFDVTGECVDIPSEPDGGASFKTKPRITAYRTVIRGGIIWVFMGPSGSAAEPPDFEWSTLPFRQRAATKRLQQCNWAQAVEGGIDSSHISYLHSRTDAQPPVARKGETVVNYWTVDRHPVFEVKEMPYGMLIAARRDAGGDDSYYWRFTQFLLPFYSMVPPRGAGLDSRDAWYYGHAWVPIDDENTWTWSFTASPHSEFNDADLELHGGQNGYWGPTDENYRPLLNKQNDYLISRDRQRTENFSGIDGIPNQDSAVQESMQPIVDRTKERLGHSDRAIVIFRRLMLRMAEDYASGRAPESANHADWYRVRSGFAVLKKSVDFERGASSLLSADPKSGGIRTGGSH